MSLTISLSTDHSAFEVELPSGCSTRISSEALAATLRRLLVEQKRAQIAEDAAREIEAGLDRQAAILAHWQRFGVGSAPSPTDQQRWHDERHEIPVDTCPFCKAMGGTRPVRTGRARGLVRRVGDVEIRRAAKTFALDDIT